MRAIDEKTFKQELRAAELIGRAVIEALKDKEQFRRHVVTEKRGGDTQTEEYVFGKYDFKAMGEAAKAVKALEELRRSALGLDRGDEGEGGLVVLPAVREDGISS